jgi:hypothetical protein
MQVGKIQRCTPNPFKNFAFCFRPNPAHCISNGAVRKEKDENLHPWGHLTFEVISASWGAQMKKDLLFLNPNCHSGF